MAFFGFFRLGEILLQSGCTYDSNIHLSVGDIAVDNVEDPKMVQINLKHSKTGQFGQRSEIYLGRTKNDLCPVTAILAYLAFRGNIQGPLFMFQNGSALTKDCFITVVREVLQNNGDRCNLLLRSQFSYRCCDNRSINGSRRLNDQGSWSVEQ